MTTILTERGATATGRATKARPARGFWWNWFRYMAHQAFDESAERTAWNAWAQSEFIRAWQGDRYEAQVEGSTGQDDPQETTRR